jgi:hypothetical protein
VKFRKLSRVLAEHEATEEAHRMMIEQTPANRREDRDPLARKVASVARVLTRLPEHVRERDAAKVAGLSAAVRCWDRGDRTGARALLEEWHLMPGQLAALSAEEIGQ